MFDAIDTSNVADYVSLPALVQAAAPRLAPAPHARLFCESMLAWKCVGQAQPRLTAHQFVVTQTGLSCATFEALVGMRVVGGEALVGHTDSTRITWAPQCGDTANKEPPSNRGDTGSDGCGGGEGGDGGGSPRPPSCPLTPGFLQLEMMAAVKKLVAPYAAPPAATAPPNGNGNWVSAGAPATLAHLLALAAPEHAEQAVRWVLAAEAGGEGVAGKFKW